MKDENWVGRLIEVRDKKTLSESYEDSVGFRPKIYQARIKQVYRENDKLFAIAHAIYEASLTVEYSMSDPDPNWTGEQYSRRKHHKAIFKIVRGWYGRRVWKPTDHTILIRYKGPKWKPVKLI